MKLNSRRCDTAKPGKHGDGAGLWLVVKPSGTRSWVLRATHRGRRREYGLGPYPVVTLAEARESALDYKRKLRSGIDPVEERRREEAFGITFAEAAVARHEARIGEYKNPKHARQWLKTLEDYAFPAIGRIASADVVASDIQRALMPIWLEKPETAMRVKQRTCSVLDYALAQGWRSAQTPRSELSTLLPKQTEARRQKYSHHAALAYRDMPTLFSRLQKSEQTVGRLALQLQILTATRPGEIRGGDWTEVDLEKREWTIPAKRMKMRRSHIIPLSGAAVCVFKMVKSFPGDMLFPGQRDGPISDATMAKSLRLAGEGLKVIDGVRPTVHGNRAAFKTWCQEQCPTVPDSVSEVALAHGDPDKVRAAYGRAEFEEARRELLANWGDYVTGQNPVKSVQDA